MQHESSGLGADVSNVIGRVATLDSGQWTVDSGYDEIARRMDVRPAPSARNNRTVDGHVKAGSCNCH